MKKKTRSKQKEEKQEKKEKKVHKQESGQENEQKFSLYSMLEVQKTASADQIKKQYKKLVLKYHPDKNQDPNAKQQFHKLKQAYDILVDPQKKKMYDQTGTIGDQQFDAKSFQSAYEYFRAMFKKVSQQDIVDFEKKYKFGSMQQQDLMDYYNKNQGNMVQLIESIPLSQNEDIPRFIKFYQQKIKQGKLIKYKIFDKTKNKVRTLADEKEQFEQNEKNKKKQSLNELALTIRSKNVNQHNDFLAALEQKYGGVKKTKGKNQKQEQKKPKKKQKNN